MLVRTAPGRAGAGAAPPSGLGQPPAPCRRADLTLPVPSAELHPDPEKQAGECPRQGCEPGTLSPFPGCQDADTGAELGGGQGRELPS